ncbi:MAG: GNAT family N-acetyltransferase [Ilumatobacteraceae bacterium]
MIEIASLRGLPHLGASLAAWHVAEWGHLYDHAVWNGEIAIAEFDAMANGSTTDQTWVAFDGSGRGETDVLGSVSLLATDDLPGFDHLTPWRASLFVAPAARGRGIGSSLVDHVLADAAANGIARVHLFTAGQEQYYLDHGWRTIKQIEHRGENAAVMVRATSPHAARRAVTSKWCGSPDTNGAYSYLRPGATPEHRDVLAGPIMPGLWLAGEATSRAYPATMHGAWFSGERAANAVLADARAGDACIVIGAGLAGLAAARTLTDAGMTVTVLEASDHLGGRAAVDSSLGIDLPLGGAWMHGDIGHPLAPHVTSIHEQWTDALTYVVGHGRVEVDDVEAAMAARPIVEAAFERAAPGDTGRDVLRAAIDSIESLTPVQRTVLEGWFTREIENLYAAPIDDFAADTGFEEYELLGHDSFITSSLTPALDHFAKGLDIRFEHRVTTLTAQSGWTTDTGLRAEHVIVTAAIGALRGDRIRFDPPLPRVVRDAIDLISAGPVTKLFATYDSAWWPKQRPIRTIGADLQIAVDMTPLTGTPVLCWFATGEAARRIERLTEHECCELVDRVARECGLLESAEAPPITRA